MPSANQSELKFELTPKQLHQLDQHPALSELVVGQPNIKALRSIYFDTPEQRLRRASIFLSVCSDGGGWVQIINAHNGASNPVQVETTVDAPVPHLDAVTHGNLQRKLVRLTKKSCLKPIFEIVIKRIARDLHMPDADLELALDEGVIRAGLSETALCEAELELKAGPPAALRALAARLIPAPAHLANKNRAERGYELAMCSSPATPQPVQGKLIALDRSDTCREAFIAIVSSVVSQIHENRRVVLEADDPEGPHQLRVGLRRLRSTLRAFRPLIDIPALQEMGKHAQALARIIGELRDADVLINDIYATVADQAGDYKGLRALENILHQHRATKRDVARIALEGVHWSRLQFHLVLCPQTIAACAGLDEPIVGISGKAIGQAWKKAAKNGRRLDSLSGEERHKMRKRLKTLRYTAELFASLYPAYQVKPFLKTLKRLQNVFGYINDVVTARQIEDIASARCHDDGNIQFAAGYVLGWHSSRALLRWGEVQDDWHDLKKAARFWR